MMGAEVAGYALQPPTTPNLFAAASVASGMRSITGDVCDLARLTQALADASPEIVFHLAAQPLVRVSYEEPILTYQTNVIGTASLLEAVRAIDSVRAVLVITSDKCYENHDWDWGYREIYILGGHDPYSSSKACAELAVSAIAGDLHIDRHNWATNSPSYGSRRQRHRRRGLGCVPPYPRYRKSLFER